MSRLNKQRGAKPKQENCLVGNKQIIAPGYCRLTLHAPLIAREVYPGQFVEVYMPPEHQPMLPRPFSVYKANQKTGEIVILFEIKGQGTRLIAAAEAGASLKLLGPLGNGFPELPSGAVLVAGGMGIAPLVFLASSTDLPRTLIYGAPTVAQLACPSSDLDMPGLTILEATEDGSKGDQGTTVDLLLRCINNAGAVFACGPCPMLQAVKNISARAAVKVWVSVEERMACGIGACVGCAVAAPGGYKRVCKDGPVFAAEEVILNE